LPVTYGQLTILWDTFQSLRFSNHTITRDCQYTMFLAILFKWLFGLSGFHIYNTAMHIGYLINRFV